MEPAKFIAFRRAADGISAILFPAFQRHDAVAAHFQVPPTNLVGAGHAYLVLTDDGRLTLRPHGRSVSLALDSCSDVTGPVLAEIAEKGLFVMWRDGMGMPNGYVVPENWPMTNFIEDCALPNAVAAGHLSFEHDDKRGARPRVCMLDGNIEQSADLEDANRFFVRMFDL